MATVQLAERESTILWQGDVVVLGGGLAGLTAARTAAAAGKSTCIVEVGPVLGRELSREWQTGIPAGGLRDSLAALNAEQGVPKGILDIFVSTLALDRIIDDDGIAVFVRVVPTRAVADSAGQLAGVEVVGKSGRQLVRAPIVIDATPQRVFSRGMLGMRSPQVVKATRRMYVHGIQVPAEGAEFAVAADIGIDNNTVSFVPASWTGEAIGRLAVAVDGGRSTSADIVGDTLKAATAVVEYLRQTSADFAEATLVDVSAECSAETAADPAGFAPLANTGVTPLPLAATLDSELSQAAEATAKALRATASAPLPPPPTTSSDTVLATAELEETTDWDAPSATLPKAIATLHEPRDVVVAGYGTGGVFAAMSAAEQGLSVAAIDPALQPGGIATAGKIHSYYHGVHVGMQQRIDERMNGAGSAIAAKIRGYHPIGKAKVLLDALNRERVDLFAGHTVFGVVKDGRRVTGVVTAAADGFHVFPCQVAIDGTGDGDLAAAAGADFILGRTEDSMPQPFSYTPTWVRDAALGHNNFDAGWANPTDTRDFSRAHALGRQRLWERGPFTEESHFCTLATVLGIRESRFITGPVRLSLDDFMQGKAHDDTLCLTFAHHDNHAVDYAQESEWALRHVAMFGLWRQLCYGELPYGAIYPKDVDGVLIACRAISIDHDLHQLVRMQPDMQTLGEICGLAAAIAVKTGNVPAQIDVAMLQDQLRDRGIYPTEPSKPLMDLPAPELLAALGGEKNGLAMWRLSLLDDGAAPDWDAFLNSEDDTVRRFNAAVAAAMRGDCSEAITSVLCQAIDERVADPALGVKSPARYIVAALALAEIAPALAVAKIPELLSDEGIAPLNAMLLFRALGKTGKPEAADAIQAYLAAHKDDDAPVALWGVGTGLPTSFRTFLDLCAVRNLQALGCFGESARLEAYVNDDNLLIRHHARELAAARAGER